LQIRLDAVVEGISRMARRTLSPDYRAALLGIAAYAIHKLTEVSESLEIR
jgi:hypothetical protein